MYGLAPEWLTRDGRVVPEVIVLSHEEQRVRLAAATPQAAERGVVAGDPCFDRMHASLGSRDEYRRMLGASDGTTVVVVSSTWGDNSLLGKHPHLVSDLLAELTMDDHVVAAVLHPNVWFAHSPWQIRSWFGEALRSGLRLIPPAKGWQQAIVAADVVIGDHGAVTGYAAALGVPTLLATFPSDEVAAGSAIEELGRSVPTLRPDEPFQDQIHAAHAGHNSTRSAGVGALTSSAPDEAAQVLRATFYRLMDLPEPEHDVPVLPYSPDDLRPVGEPVRAMWVACDWTGARQVHVRRWPADVTARRRRGPRGTEAHLAVHSEHPRRDLRNNSTVVVLPTERRPGEPHERLAEVLRERVACTVAIVATGQRRYLVHHRDHGLMTVRVVAPPAGQVDPAAVASVVHSWWSGALRGGLPSVLTLSLGPDVLRLELALD